MNRPGYREAIEWIAWNDDTKFLNDSDGLSVTATMVRDLFAVSEEKVLKDLQRAVDRVREGG